MSNKTSIKNYNEIQCLADLGVTNENISEEIQSFFREETLFFEQFRQELNGLVEKDGSAIARIIAAIQQQQLINEYTDGEEEKTGCAYGHAAFLHYDNAWVLARAQRLLLGTSLLILTPMERLIAISEYQKEIPGPVTENSALQALWRMLILFEFQRIWDAIAALPAYSDQATGFIEYLKSKGVTTLSDFFLNSWQELDLLIEEESLAIERVMTGLQEDRMNKYFVSPFDPTKGCAYGHIVQLQPGEGSSLMVFIINKMQFHGKQLTRTPIEEYVNYAYEYDIPEEQVNLTTSFSLRILYEFLKFYAQVHVPITYGGHASAIELVPTITSTEEIQAHD